MHGRVRLVDLEVLLITRTNFTAQVEVAGTRKRAWVSLHEVELYEIDGSVDARTRELTCPRLYAERKGLLP